MHGPVYGDSKATQPYWYSWTLYCALLLFVVYVVY